MRKRLFASLALGVVLLPVLVHAGTRTAINYTISTDTADFGGVRTAISGVNIFNSSGSASRGIGITGRNITNCTGSTQGTTAAETGITAGNGVVNSSTAINGSGSSLALQSNIAIGCQVFGPTSITYKYNMP